MKLLKLNYSESRKGRGMGGMGKVTSYFGFSKIFCLGENFYIKKKKGPTGSEEMVYTPGFCL